MWCLSEALDGVDGAVIRADVLMKADRNEEREEPQRERKSARHPHIPKDF